MTAIKKIIAVSTTQRCKIHLNGDRHDRKEKSLHVYAAGKIKSMQENDDYYS